MAGRASYGDGSPGQPVEALKASVTTIRGAHVSAASEPRSAEAAWGFTVSGTTLLELIKLGDVDVLDAFRTYVYHADVYGVSDGVRIEAHEQTSEGSGDEKRYTGTEGGFGGTLLNGSIKDCSVERLNAVTGLNYAGGV